jgi:hypothetical protein
MLSSLSQAGIANSGTTPFAPRSSFLSSRSLRLLLVVLVILPAGFAQTNTTAKADVKASGKPAPAKPSNPLATVLQGKPVVPTANQPLPAAIPEPEPSPTSIPLPEVAARSQELGQMLRDLSSQLPTPEQLNTIRTSLAELQPELQSKKKEVDALLSSTPNSLEVREQETYWRGMQSYNDSWHRQLLTWANNAQAGTQKLNEQEAIWAATLRENQGAKELDPVVELISDNLNDIRKLRTLAKDELQTIVTMQIQASACVDMAGDALDRLAQARKQLTGHFLNRDSLPLWQIANRREAGEIAPDYGTINNRKIAIEAFFHENAGALVAVIFLLIVSQVLAYRLHVLVRERNLEPDLAPEVQHILSHWFALGLLPPLMFGYALVPSAPISLIGLVILISFIPILRLLPPFLEHRFQVMLRILVGFSAANAAITRSCATVIRRVRTLFPS